MRLREVVRGSVEEFTTTFTDQDGGAVTPASAELIVNYLGEDGERVSTEPITATEQTDGSWFALWDTSVAQPAQVDWVIRSTNPASAEQGSFMLVANLANLSE